MSNLEVFNCSCFWRKHQLQVSRIDEPDWDDIRFSLSVPAYQHDSVWKRIKTCFYWLFLKRGSFEFDEILLTKADARRMIAYLEQVS